MESYLVADHFAGIRHLFEQLVQSPQGSDNRPLVAIGHLADLLERTAFAPGVSYIYQRLFDGLHILLLLDLDFALAQNLVD